MKMQGYFVVLAQCRGDPALRVLGAGFIQFALAEHVDVPRACQLNRGAHAGNPAAQDKKIHPMTFCTLHEGLNDSLRSAPSQLLVSLTRSSAPNITHGKAGGEGVVGFQGVLSEPADWSPAI